EVQAQREVYIGPPLDGVCAIEARVRELPAVKKWLTLRPQISSAERAVRDADRVIQAVQHARAILELNPEPDLACKLRESESRYDAAVAAKAAAERDLATIRHLVAPLWVSAANSIPHACTTAVLARDQEVQDAGVVAKRSLRDAIAKVEAVISAVVGTVLVPALVEASALEQAGRQLIRGMLEGDNEVTAKVIGPHRRASRGGQAVLGGRWRTRARARRPPSRRCPRA
ncbi:MAG: hypothetical protein K2V38_17720, partial [Gemmataceae bacterium]|nr:hypothetical protein [Gemmataceae bacterium]